MSTVIHIEKRDNLPTAESARQWADVVRNLPPDGWLKITIEEVKRGYTPTRYKFYFAHVLEVILHTCGRMFEIMDGNEFRPVRSTTEIHECLKLKYNPVFVRTPFGGGTVAGSTTGLSDSEFINQYEETIISEFSGPPFNCEFMMRDEWAAWMKNGKKH